MENQTEQEVTPTSSDPTPDYAAQLAALQEELAGYKQNDDKLRASILSDPRVAKVLSAISSSEEDGERGLLRAMIDNYGFEFKDALDSEEMQEELMTKQQERIAAESQQKETQRQQAENWLNSEKVIDAFKEEKGLTDDETVELVNEILDFSYKIFMSEISHDILELGYNAMRFDESVAEAKEEGRRSGKNESISMELRKTKQTGDGVPVVSNDTPATKKIQRENKRFRNDADSVYANGGYGSKK